jgi:hypothetical protein
MDGTELLAASFSCWPKGSSLDPTQEPLVLHYTLKEVIHWINNQAPNNVEIGEPGEFCPTHTILFKKSLVVVVQGEFLPTKCFCSKVFAIARAEP